MNAIVGIKNKTIKVLKELTASCYQEYTDYLNDIISLSELKKFNDKINYHYRKVCELDLTCRDIHEEYVTPILDYASNFKRELNHFESKLKFLDRELGKEFVKSLVEIKKCSNTFILLIKIRNIWEHDDMPSFVLHRAIDSAPRIIVNKNLMKNKIRNPKKEKKLLEYLSMDSDIDVIESIIDVHESISKLMLTYYNKLLTNEIIIKKQDVICELFQEYCMQGFVCIGNIDKHSDSVKISSQVQIPIHMIVEQYIDYICLNNNIVILVSTETPNKISCLSPPFIVEDNLVRALKRNVLYFNGEYYYLIKQKVEFNKLLVAAYKKLDDSCAPMHQIDRCISITLRIYNIFEDASFSIRLARKD